MVLKAIGKWIDTMPISELFSQEEHLADTVTFEVERFYNGYDLGKFTFFMRGVTESGGETQTELEVIQQEDVLHLHWHVSDRFTAEAGTLSLDLYGVCYAPQADPSAEMPEAIIRYQLPPVQVHGLPDSDRTLDSQSYTAFLLEVKAAANDAAAMIDAKMAEFEENYPEYAETLARMEEKLTQQEQTIRSLSVTVSDLSSRILQLEENASSGIRALTQSEFDALDAPDEGTLYVITD